MNRPVKRVALITGANRGLGLEASRRLAALDYVVVLTSRDAKKGEAAAESLRSAKADVRFHALDVSSDASVAALENFMKDEFGRCDVLVNNAGVFPEQLSVAPLGTTPEVFMSTLESNLGGPYRMCRAFVPLMRENNYGRIVNVSSGMGQLWDMEGGWPAYRISKTGLNALTRVLSRELKGSHILVNSVCPGWVRTDMGGPQASRSIEEGAEGIVWAATLPDDGPTGGFFRDGQPLDW